MKEAVVVDAVGAVVLVARAVDGREVRGAAALRAVAGHEQEAPGQLSAKRAQGVGRMPLGKFLKRLGGRFPVRQVSAAHPLEPVRP